MKLEQEPEFRPITITLETEDEVKAVWDAVGGRDSASVGHRKILIAISDWFSTEAKI